MLWCHCKLVSETILDLAAVCLAILFFFSSWLSKAFWAETYCSKFFLVIRNCFGCIFASHVELLLLFFFWGASKMIWQWGCVEEYPCLHVARRGVWGDFEALVKGCHYWLTSSVCEGTIPYCFLVCCQATKLSTRQIIPALPLKNDEVIL